MNRVLTGLDHIRNGKWKDLKGYRLGLLSNQASLDGKLNTAKGVFSSLLPHCLKALFGPQHGYGCEAQANMVETRHSFDNLLNIPIFSLYGSEREPLPQMLDMIDILIIDLQDVGTRVYTFATTMFQCLKAAARNKKKVIILDRPNPLGGNVVEGNLLHRDFYSFVGPCKFPMRHGLTMGEMAQIFNHIFALDCDLEIVPMEGWRREMLWHDTGLKWSMPSPNMPFFETAYVYPGQVIWEGTNISEGRGTCRPFEIFGSPYLDTKSIKKKLKPEAVKGCFLQEYSFCPTFDKWEGELCYGFFIHITDPHVYMPYFTSLSLLRAIIETHQSDFQWTQPPYEYEYKKKPIDLIMGGSSVRIDLESKVPLSQIKRKWSEELESFVQWRKPYLIYS